jgi:hypothetical protein
VRNDSDLRLVANREHARHLRRRSRQCHEPRAAAKQAAEILEVRLDGLGCVETGIAAEQRANAADCAFEARVYGGTGRRHCGLVSRS